MGSGQGRWSDDAAQRGHLSPLQRDQHADFGNVAPGVHEWRPALGNLQTIGRTGLAGSQGERGTTGFFFRRLEIRDDTKPDDDEDSVRRIPLLRAFTLFHASQIDGIPDYVPPTIEEAPWRAPEAAEIILANSGAVVRYGGERAFFSPGTDHIQMPPQSAFATAEGFCGTLIHELSHWSGAESRLNRDLRNRFGSHDYAREELRAEIGQMMVCGELGLPSPTAIFQTTLPTLHPGSKSFAQ